MSDEEKVVVNGKEEKPIRKFKLPLGVKWEEIVREKLKEKEAEEKQ